jgi:hypothetical protein
VIVEVVGVEVVGVRLFPASAFFSLAHTLARRRTETPDGGFFHAIWPSRHQRPARGEAERTSRSASSLTTNISLPARIFASSAPRTKVPELKDGQYVQVPRYEWKDVGSSHVVP